MGIDNVDVKFAGEGMAKGESTTLGSEKTQTVLPKPSEEQPPAILMTPVEQKPVIDPVNPNLIREPVLNMQPVVESTSVSLPTGENGKTSTEPKQNGEEQTETVSPQQEQMKRLEAEVAEMRKLLEAQIGDNKELKDMFTKLMGEDTSLKLVNEQLKKEITELNAKLMKLAEAQEKTIKATIEIDDRERRKEVLRGILKYIAIIVASPIIDTVQTAGQTTQATVLQNEAPKR